MAHALLFIVGLVVGLYLLYLWALPKPLPGIPYNKAATSQLLGDIPDMVAEIKRHGDVYQWFRDQNARAGVPMHQIFIKPLSRPAVILADPRESRDLLTHRSADFDKSRYSRELFRPILGNAQVTLPTGPAWKMHRRLSQDAMTPRFLHSVAAPNIHISCANFVALWEHKARLADGRPFDAGRDMFHTALDAVIAFTFGGDYPHRAVQPQLESLARLSPAYAHIAKDNNTPVNFPHVEIHEELESMIQLCERVDAIHGRGVPGFGWMLEKLTSRFKSLERSKNETIRRQVQLALERMQRTDETVAEDEARNGIDLIVNRERVMAAKENRQPEYFSNPIQSEIFGLIIGGHDTSSATACWSVKLFATHRDIQTRLRKALQSAYVDAMTEQRQPTVQEIQTTCIPYLEATIEELFRLCPVVPLTSREAIRDTELLGHAIPKGTVVFQLNKGPGYTMPAYNVEEAARSHASQRDNKDGKVKSWAREDVAQFKPERWLVHDTVVEGSVKFDADAGPSNAFGLGLRSCFGRRLAYISFRMLLVSIIWNFELLECPEELSDYRGTFGIVYKPQRTYVRLAKVNF